MEKIQTWPYFAEDEIAAVEEVLRSGRVNQWSGDRVAAFEDVAAKQFQVPHALAVSNGSVALELALHALGIGSGDEVIVTSRSFVASATCVLLAGAKPVFADVDSHSQNITVEAIEPLITAKTRAVIPVHLAGWPCDMPEIMALAKTKNLLVIEDCAQAVGAGIDGRPVGSFGDAAAMSFCQDKIISTGGEGGMLLFQEKDAYERAWQFRDHGKSLDAKKSATGRVFRFIHDGIGTNLRLP
ncbi:MAG: DegT/DnrJ/EryC1/StrS family aminotransferase, partial [Methyloligellaceae bacterium]